MKRILSILILVPMLILCLLPTGIAMAVEAPATPEAPMEIEPEPATDFFWPFGEYNILG